MANHLSHDTKSRIVSLDARPEPIAIDTASTAVIVVDMQNDFGAKGGVFDRAGISPLLINILTYTGRTKRPFKLRNISSRASLSR